MNTLSANRTCPRRRCRRLRRWRTRWVSRTMMIRQIAFASKPAPTGSAVFVSLCGQSREHRAFNQRRPAGREAQPRKSSWWLTTDRLRGTPLIDSTHVPDRLHARLCRSCRRLRRWRTRWVSRTIMIRQIGFASKPAPTGLAVFVTWRSRLANNVVSINADRLAARLNLGNRPGGSPLIAFVARP